MKILEASINDAPEILKLQKAAYQSEAILNNDFNIPPLTQSLEALIEDFKIKTVLKIMDNEQLLTSGQTILASGQARFESGSCYIGRMAVWPELRGKGIGSTLLSALEQLFEGTKRIELFTGERSHSNLAMYQRRGYKEFKRQTMGSTTVIFLEKFI